MNRLTFEEELFAYLDLQLNLAELDKGENKMSCVERASQMTATINDMMLSHGLKPYVRTKNQKSKK